MDSTHSGTATVDGAETTTVTVRCTGKVRDTVGTSHLDVTFHGNTLRALLDTFFEQYPVQDMIIAETETAATAHGWAPAPEDLPGTWRKNPVGEQTRKFARVTVNGTFNEHLDGFDTILKNGDRVALLYPFMGLNRRKTPPFTAGIRAVTR